MTRTGGPQTPVSATRRCTVHNRLSPWPAKAPAAQLAMLEAVQHRAGAILTERSRFLQAAALMLGALQAVGHALRPFGGTP
jgi:hypothetical protein